MLKNRTLLYYMTENSDSLLPTDLQVSNISDKDWYKALKPFFNDLIWQYYADRVVFVDTRFKLDASDQDIINNIIRSFAINLKTRDYEYEKLYETTILEYNPIWNVDGVVGTIHEQTYNDTTNQTKSGSDTLHHTGNDDTQHRGDNDLQHRGYDEVEYEKDTQNFVNTYDSIDYNPPAEYPESHTHEVDDENKTTYNSNDKTLFNSNDKTIYASDEETEYDSAVDGSKDSFQRDLDLMIRQGNIGVTMTQDMINKEREVALYDFYKLIVHDCVNTCTYAVE